MNTTLCLTNSRIPFIHCRQDENTETSKPKPAPKKLNIDWAAKAKERAAIKEETEPVSYLNLYFLE